MNVLEGLNPQQIEAVQAVRGPVCILAGAGSGKTTTITRRIANQVRSGALEPASILAVTFTDKAAGEMRARLAALGVSGVRARTFHAAALAQLHHLAEEAPGHILPSKAMAVRQLANRLPKPYRFRAALDLATEIEWAKNRRIGPHEYLERLGEHEPPIPADLMSSLYSSYEEGKSARGLIDFEDLLELAVGMFENDVYACERFQARYLAFTVDEYQDVNLLQQTLLERWLGERDDLCVVGDDYQSIYGFTGASARYLLEMPARFARTKVIRLEKNYRSTPEVLATANHLVPKLGGAHKVLEAVRGPGPAPVTELCGGSEEEANYVARRAEQLHGEGVPYEEMAVLYRVNFRSEDFEEALARRRIPYQVKDGAFLTRPAARRMLASLGRRRSSEVGELVLQLAQRDGYLEDVPEDVGGQELTRQKDLARLVRQAQQFEDGAVSDFVADLKSRYGSEDEGRGVNLLTYHRSKGLEFEAVFLPRLAEGELPFKRARSTEAVAEERRLFYVGITRAKTHLTLSHPVGNPSRFLDELDPGPVAPRREHGDAFTALRSWRAQRARADNVPAYLVFHDSTLEEIARTNPSSPRQLAAISGIGPAKLERYGAELISVLMTVE
jgi:DNA helicase-2/ATP-dependent DNA helicase PcrA